MNREPLAEAMSQKSQNESGQERLTIRRQSVEPVNGNLKSNLGFRRFCRSGLAAVQAEWALMCIAHNLNRLIVLARGGLLASFFSSCCLCKPGPGPARRIPILQLARRTISHRLAA